MGSTRSAGTGWALAQPRWTRAKAAVVQRGLSRESAPNVLGGLSGSCQASHCWRVSPAGVQWIPQGSRTLCAITAGHLYPLRVLETQLRTFLYPSFPPLIPPSTHTPGPSCTHSPDPRGHPGVPDPSQRSSRAKDSPSASTDPSTPIPRGPQLLPAGQRSTF